MSAAAASGGSTTIIRTKPLMSLKNILLMNLGFFGIQYSFGMQQTAINPIYQMLGASADELPLLNLAGPITDVIVRATCDVLIVRPPAGLPDGEELF